MATQKENLAILAAAFGMSKEDALNHLLEKAASICDHLDGPNARLELVVTKSNPHKTQIKSTVRYPANSRRGGIVDCTG